MKYIKFAVLSLMIISSLGCKKEKHENTLVNIFADPDIRKIYTFQDKRDTKNICRFLKDKKTLNRQYAALSLGTVQDVKSIPKLLPLLNDPYNTVRKSAAYSLGQIGSSDAEKPLINSFEKEKEISVKNHILEAIGKCGSEAGLNFLINLLERKAHIQYSEGIALGFYRFLLKNISSYKAVGKVVGLLNSVYSRRTRFYSANFLARMKKYDLMAYSNAVLQSIKSEKDIFIRMNLALSLGKIRDSESLDVLKKILDSGEDYRVRVNAIKALKHFDFKSYIDILKILLNDDDRNVGLVASQLLLSENRGEISCNGILILIKDVKDKRIRSIMLSSALKVSRDKKKVSMLIRNYYKKSKNVFEKGFLLESLSYYRENFKFISSEIFNNSDKFLATSGMAAVANMIKIDSLNNLENKNVGMNRNSIFSILKKGINSRDSALMTISASALRDPELQLKNKTDDLTFLKKAIDLCKLPKDVEPYLELKKTLNYFEGRNERVNLGMLNAKPVDWKFVRTISPETYIKIKTVRGDITVLLNVNNSPGSVSNFIKLLKSGFFKNGFFHRVVPNFVVQDGCPRGDGWGGPGYSIRSEFFPDHYYEGTVGMASAGKDTEGSQWFITHSPTPHLDGKYSVIGHVIKGMNIVHKIEIGDKIENIILI